MNSDEAYNLIWGKIINICTVSDSAIYGDLFTFKLLNSYKQYNRVKNTVYSTFVCILGVKVFQEQSKRGMKCSNKERE